MREIALDTETTGLDPFSGHRVVEIGCVEMFGRVRTGQHFHAYLNPERDVPPEAFRVHGLSQEFLSDKPFFFEIAKELLDFIGDSPLVIHNAEFDMKFVNWELKNSGLPTLEFSRATDTVKIARKKFPGSPANLDALCNRFSIDRSARTKHGALLDAELLAEVYLELMGGRQDAMRLEAVAEIIAENADQITGLAPRHFPPNEQELAAHDAFIRKLKNALWLKDEAA